MSAEGRAALLIGVLFILILCGLEAGLVRIYGPEPGFKLRALQSAASWQLQE